MLGPIPPIDPRIVGIVLSLGTSVLGVAIAYIAFRGYRQGSRPMLYIAVGFVLVFPVEVLSFGGALLFGSVPEYVFGLVSETSKFVGLATILYGLRMPGGEYE